MQAAALAAKTAVNGTAKSSDPETFIGVTTGVTTGGGGLNSGTTWSEFSRLEPLLPPRRELLLPLERLAVTLAESR